MNRNAPTAGVPTFDAATGPSDSNLGSASITLASVVVNSGHSGTYLHVVVTCESLGTDVVSVSRHSQSFTRVGGVTNSSDGWQQVWELKNPDSGTFDSTITVDTPARTIIVATSYYNVNQTTPLGTHVKQTGNATSWTQNITASSTDLVINYDMAGATAITETPPQIEMANINGSWAWAGSYTNGSGTVTVGATISTGARQFSQWTNLLKQ